MRVLLANKIFINSIKNQKMNKLLFICGLILLNSTTAQEDEDPLGSEPIALYVEQPKEVSYNLVTATDIYAEPLETDFSFIVTETDATDLNLEDIPFIEEESIIDLGFNVEDYLPENFNPYGYYFDVNAIVYIEDEEVIDLGFDVAMYLPEGFDPYEEIVHIDTINFIADEEEIIDLGFDTSPYLPHGFDPYVSQK